MLDEELGKIGNNIKFARKLKKISQEKLAETIGVSRNYVGMIERGETNIPTKTLILIAKALDVKPKTFLEI